MVVWMGEEGELFRDTLPFAVLMAAEFDEEDEGDDSDDSSSSESSESSSSDDEDEDSSDEPAVRKEAVVGKNVPKGGSDLNKLVDAWDDTDD
jgi:hypothetical protein